MDVTEIHRRAAAFWSDHTRRASGTLRRWWQSPRAWAHINTLVDPSAALAGMHGAFHKRMAAFSPDGCFGTAVSVGCGSGEKELRLLKAGIVKSFELYEISSERIQRGRQRAIELKLEDRVTFIEGDAFHECLNRGFDLVYWNNSLHHMLDVEKAIEWSKDRLNPKGLFAMDDFIGPSRFQWTDANLAYASSFRAALPDRLLVHPENPEKRISQKIQRPSIEGMIKADPTEAADSDNIIPSIKRTFKNPEIIRTGGCIYHIGMNDVLANVKDEVDFGFLDLGFLIDQSLNEQGESQYGVCFATK